MLNLSLDLAIHRARRLVEEQERRICRDSAREGQKLALPYTERRSPLSELVSVAIW